ncbi:p-hydroxybenzoic acid efflux pump subunit AaeB, partial [Klebsiella pneumoniae]|nr:p-hydroxybenzoic acid efflux pump subunit AaeB [Klebsiella pneumoniae]
SLFVFCFVSVFDADIELYRIVLFLFCIRDHNTAVTMYCWVGAASRYLLLKRGVMGNTKISLIEDGVLRGETVVKVE